MTERPARGITDGVIAISSLLLLVAIGLLVTRAATVVLVATGMSAQNARFQARSAFTGTGFTTSEAEDMVRHPVRRRVAMNLMLLGHAGFVAAAGSLILGFRNGSLSHDWKSLIELVAGMLALLAVSRSRWVDRRLTALMGHLVRRYTDLEVRDVASLLDLSGSYAVSELAVEDADWVANRTLADLALRDEGVAVLGITRQDGTFRGAPVGSTMVRPGDVLLLYGHGGALEELDRRPAGAGGDRAHRSAIDHQLAVVAAEEARDIEEADGVIDLTGPAAGPGPAGRRQPAERVRLDTAPGATALVPPKTSKDRSPGPTAER